MKKVLNLDYRSYSPSPRQITTNNTAQFGIDLGWEPNWDFKPRYSKRYLASKKNLVPIGIDGNLDTSAFKDKAAVLEFATEAKRRGYDVYVTENERGDYDVNINPNSLDTLTSAELLMLENPYQGVLPYSQTETLPARGSSPEYQVLRSELQARYDAGDYLTDRAEALQSAIGNIPISKLVFRGGRDNRYNIGTRHSPSIEQQSQLPGQIIDKNTGKPARLVSYVEGAPNDKINHALGDVIGIYGGKSIGVLHSALKDDLTQTYEDADSDYMEGAKSTPSSELKHFSPIMYIAYETFENGHGESDTRRIYFPIQNNALITRLMKDNKEDDLVEQAGLDEDSDPDAMYELGRYDNDKKQWIRFDKPLKAKQLSLLDDQEEQIIDPEQFIDLEKHPELNFDADGDPMVW